MRQTTDGADLGVRAQRGPRPGRIHGPLLGDMDAWRYTTDEADDRLRRPQLIGKALDRHAKGASDEPDGFERTDCH